MKWCLYNVEDHDIQEIYFNSFDGAITHYLTAPPDFRVKYDMVIVNKDKKAIFLSEIIASLGDVFKKTFNDFIEEGKEDETENEEEGENKYKLVRGYDIQKVESEVNKFLKEGWILLGFPRIYPNGEILQALER